MLNTDTELETKFIARFVVKSKRERYLTFIQSEKKRPKLIADLSHMNFLNYSLFDKVTSNEYDIIKQKIKTLGNIKDCYVISENKDIDKKRLNIELALTLTIGADQGNILVFGNAEIIYAEAEGINNRWISK